MKATDSYLRVVSDSICAEQKTLHGLYLRPVFGVSDKVKLKPACSVTETS